MRTRTIILNCQVQPGRSEQGLLDRTLTCTAKRYETLDDRLIPQSHHHAAAMKASSFERSNVPFAITLYITTGLLLITGCNNLAVATSNTCIFLG